MATVVAGYHFWYASAYFRSLESLAFTVISETSIEYAVTWVEVLTHANQTV